MRILTWNLNHRAKRPTIKPGVAASIEALCPDVAVLTEYVPGPTREEFVGAIHSQGLKHILVSRTSCTVACNHVLIAAREPLEPGDLVPPVDIEEHVPSNVLHVRLPLSGVDVLGLRIPDYSKKRALRRRCWDWLETAAISLRSRKAVITGDLNTDPSYEPANCGDRFARLQDAGWTHALPPEGCSYWNLDGDSKRLDHAFLAPGISMLSARYVTGTGVHRMAGKGALSDHAALLVEADL